MAAIKDGTSNTFLAGEMHIPSGKLNTVPFNGPLFNGEELASHSRIGGPGVPIRTSNQDAGEIFGFGSAHPGNCNFAFADGSVRAVDNTIDTIVLADICHRADGNVVVE